jgi:HSP20 family protein
MEDRNMNRQSRRQEDDESRPDSARGQRTGERSDMPAPLRGAGESSSFAGMNQLMHEMDRMFEGLWRNPLAAFGGRWNGGDVLASQWLPSLEMHEHDGEFIVRADLPGMRKQDVEVEVVGQSLVIQGERRQGCESDDDGWHRSECRYGRFVRSVPLPEHVDPERIRAHFQDGILELRMPARQRREARRRIEVSEGDGQDGGASRGRSKASRSGRDAPEST